MRRLKPLVGGIRGCLNCGYTPSVLPLSTVLYYGFGGWTVTCDKRTLYPATTKGGDVRRHKDDTMAVGDRRPRDFEVLAARTRGRDWRATVNLALRDAEYQRQGKGRWVLVKEGLGFA